MVNGKLIDRQSAKSIKSSNERSYIAARCMSVAKTDPASILSSTGGFSIMVFSIWQETRSMATQTKKNLYNNKEFFIFFLFIKLG